VTSSRQSLPLDAGTCIIRAWRHADREALVRHANNRRVWLTLRDQFPHPYTHAEGDAWLAYVAKQQPITNFAIAVGGDAAGGIGVAPQPDVHRRSAEVGYWLGEDFWNRGIMTDAVRAFTAYAFDAYDLIRIFAGVFSSNPASMRVLEKAGYTREGVLRRSVVKDGQVLDQVLYAVTR
jgi:RimJ/RimL family protein N-acetyltransferase